MCEHMKKAIALILMSLQFTLAFATVPLQVSMLKVVKASDHVLSVTIINVDMVNDKGEVVEDPNAMTGPGLSNTIRLICKVLEVHRTNAANVPEIIKIPLDQMMHYSLGQIKKHHINESPPMIVVLKGESFDPAYAGVFGYPMYELESILKLFDDKEYEGK